MTTTLRQLEEVILDPAMGSRYMQKSNLKMGDRKGDQVYSGQPEYHRQRCFNSRINKGHKI